MKLNPSYCLVAAFSVWLLTSTHARAQLSEVVLGGSMANLLESPADETQAELTAQNQVWNGSITVPPDPGMSALDDYIGLTGTATARFDSGGSLLYGASGGVAVVGLPAMSFTSFLLSGGFSALYTVTGTPDQVTSLDLTLAVSGSVTFPTAAPLFSFNLSAGAATLNDYEDIPLDFPLGTANFLSGATEGGLNLMLSDVGGMTTATVSGTLLLSTPVTLDADGSVDVVIGQVFAIQGVLTGSSTGGETFNIGMDFGNTFVLDAAPSEGGVTLELVAPVPEPATRFLMVAAGVVLAAGMMRRRAQRQ